MQGMILSYEHAKFDSICYRDNHFVWNNHLTAAAIFTSVDFKS